MIWSALPLRVEQALMCGRRRVGKLLRSVGSCSVGGVMAAYNGVEPAYCALATERNRTPTCAHAPQRGPLQPARFSAAWWPAAWAPCLGPYGARYLAMGAAAGAVAVVGTLLSPGAVAPAARVCRRPSGDPSRHSRSWGASAQMAPLPARGGLVLLALERAI